MTAAASAALHCHKYQAHISSDCSLLCRRGGTGVMKSKRHPAPAAATAGRARQGKAEILKTTESRQPVENLCVLRNPDFPEQIRKFRF